MPAENSSDSATASKRNPYNYTSFSDKEVVGKLLGSMPGKSSVNFETTADPHRKKLPDALRSIGDIWVMIRNPYLEEDLLQDRIAASF